SGRLRQAAEYYQEALRWGEQLTAAAPEDFSNQGTLAHVTANLGNLLSQLGKKKDGEKQLRRPVQLQEKVAGQGPGVLQRARLANFYRELGLRQRDLGQLKEAAETHQKSLNLSSQLHGEFPNVPDYAHRHARILFFVAQDLTYL